MKNFKLRCGICKHILISEEDISGYDNGKPLCSKCMTNLLEQEEDNSIFDVICLLQSEESNGFFDSLYLTSGSNNTLLDRK